MWVSCDTIYRWIYYPHQRHRQLWQYLPRTHAIPATTSRGMLRAVAFASCARDTVANSWGRRVCSDRIWFRISIHERPTHINDRSVCGHLGVRLYRGSKVGG